MVDLLETFLLGDPLAILNLLIATLRKVGVKSS
jgi:hypothetical protein